MWYEYLENNKFICMLYDVVPDLKGVDIAGAKILNNGPTIHLGFDLATYADFPTKKWDKSFNTVGLVLVFTDVSDLIWQGWSVKNIADIHIAVDKKRYQILVEAKDMKINFTASFIDVKEVHGLCREDRM